ncbi:MAG: hypothetical protein RBR34_00140 [Rhodospirillaceae bacterium]|nr:hypothetical protein [Rhodospirillaceae bacterium]
MTGDKPSSDGTDPRLIQNLLKLAANPTARDSAEPALSRLTPEDRARALDLAATLIRQARKEAGGTPAEAGNGEEVVAKPARPVIRPGRADGEDRPKSREILFRGTVYTFKSIGAGKPSEKRLGVVERWETEIEVEDGESFSLVIEESVDGRFSPWSFEGVFFSDFVQAAIVGVVAGSFQAKWLREQWQHHREHRRFVLMVMPVVALAALVIGIAIGLQF